MSQMCGSDGLIIPLFYDVEPSDVRHAKRDFEKAFKCHGGSGRYSHDEIAKWKRDLKTVASRSGWELKCTGGYEGKLVKIVVLDILRIMQKDHLDVAKCPAGLKERVDKVIELLEMESNTNLVTVGIRGMGGVGKTTLAKAVYNNLRHKFEKACFISDVRHRAAPDNKGLPELQRQVLWDLIKYDVKVNDVSQGKNLMRDCLSSQIELVILDDVDHIHQLDALRGGSFGAGSKIIVTTRELHVLNVGRIDRLYEPPALESDEALRLFSWHAFLRANPSGKLYHLSEKIVEACGGLPLSLEVMGAYLYDKQDDERLWHEALTKLGRAMYKDIQGNLRISYEGLNREEREMFLDIACFFIGIERETALSIWESQGMCPATAVTDLVLKSLIKLSSDDRLTMHDQLRDMGRAIVVEEVDQIVSRTRLWVAKEVKEALKATGGTDKLRGLSYEPGKEKKWRTANFEAMPSLQLLSLNNCIIQGRVVWNSCLRT